MQQNSNCADGNTLSVSYSHISFQQISLFHRTMRLSLRQHFVPWRNLGNKQPKCFKLIFQGSLLVGSDLMAHIRFSLCLFLIFHGADIVCSYICYNEKARHWSKLEALQQPESGSY